eukprot:TRINITY_DN282_c0_g1_i1.p1 TRINITY_DN282_c0_g1~~TRINITY_DN282_c0_g1_i1.p1  ORF type:complete len:181 (-),score=7.23 TRINITY_DN282_c0_g1_i1:736-1278(-)
MDACAISFGDPTRDTRFGSTSHGYPQDRCPLLTPTAVWEDGPIPTRDLRGLPALRTHIGCRSAAIVIIIISGRTPPASSRISQKDQATCGMSSASSLGIKQTIHRFVRRPESTNASLNLVVPPECHSATDALSAAWTVTAVRQGSVPDHCAAPLQRRTPHGVTYTHQYMHCGAFQRFAPT